MNNQSPISNHQTNSNHQIPTTKLFGNWLLGIGYWLVIVSWLLVIPCNAGIIDPLRIGDGARSLAMGRTSAAAPGRLGALSGNPANLAGITNFGITSMQTKIAEDVNYILLKTGFPTSYGKFAIGYLGAGVAGIDQTTKESTGRISSTGTFDYSNTVIPLTWARSINTKLDFGTTLKIYNKSFAGISGGTASGLGLDIGALVKPRENIILGISLQNLFPSSFSNIGWTSGTKEELPATFKCGTSFPLREDILTALDLNIFTDSPAELRGGLEWSINPLLALRAGIEYLPTGGVGYVANPAFGIGLKKENIEFDYAYYLDSALSANSTHYLSLSLQIYQQKRKEEKPQEFSKEDKEQIIRIDNYIKHLNEKLKSAKTAQRKKQLKLLLEDEYAKRRKIF